MSFDLAAAVWIFLAVVGTGLVAFGVVLYRGAERTGGRATGAGLGPRYVARVGNDCPLQQ
jgi:hypothetical protein